MFMVLVHVHSGAPELKVRQSSLVVHLMWTCCALDVD